MRVRRVVAGVFLAVTVVLPLVVSTAPAPPASAAGSKAPFKLAFLDIETGPYALPDRHNALLLAVKQLNAKGGIDGHHVDVSYYDSGLLPQQAVTAVQQALSSHPTAMIGLDVDDQVQAVENVVKASGVPLIAETAGPITDYANTHAKNIFDIEPDTYLQLEAVAKYIESLHPKTVGIETTSDTNSLYANHLVKSLLQKAGIKHFVDETVSDSATDTTPQVLAINAAKPDVVMVWGFPGPDALFVNQAAQNGLTAPLILDPGADEYQEFGLYHAAALKNAAYQPYCDPDVLSTPQSRAFHNAYLAAYPGSPDSAASQAYSYDAVEALAHAVKNEGGSLDSSKIVSALERLKFVGACGPYKTDPKTHTMMDQMLVVKLSPKGLADKKLIAKYTFPPVSPSNRA